MEYESIIGRLIEARKAMKLTQTQAGELLGLSTAGLSDIENMRHRGLTVERLLVMCDWYAVDPVWVLTGVTRNVDTGAILERLQIIQGAAGDMVAMLTDAKGE